MSTKTAGTAERILERVLNRRRGRVAVLVVVTGVLTLSLATSAFASPTRRFENSFGGGSFANPIGVAINQSTHHIYVANTSHQQVENFEPSGSLDPTKPQLTGPALPAPWGVAVDNSGGAKQGYIYVSVLSSAGFVQQYDPAGSATSVQINEASIPPAFQGNGSFAPTGVAVDSSGNVYAADNSNNVIDKFSPSGTFVAQLGSGSLSGLELIAVDASGNIYVATYPAGLFELSPTGVCLNACAPIDPSGTQGVAIDPTSGDILSSNSYEIREYNPAHALVTSFSGFGASEGLAVDQLSGKVYIADYYASSGLVFSSLRSFPDVSTGPVEGLAQFSGTLTGHVDPAGGAKITECHFEYGTDTSYGSGTAPCSQPLPLEGPTNVTANVSGLTSETTYHYRLVAGNADGDSSSGEDKTFTPHAVLALTTKPATGLASTTIGTITATLNASFVGTGEDTHYYFELGTSQSYGQKTPAPPGADAGAPIGPQATPLSVPVGELSPVTTYHYRIVASNNAGTSYGQDETLTTIPATPVVAGTEFVTNVNSDSALLHAQINPEGGEVEYHFEYATDQEYGVTHTYAYSAPVPDGKLTAATTAKAVSAQLADLEPGTTYHWRIVAKNETGTAEGADRKLTTFAYSPVIDDPCPNALARQQTRAALLLDCRAYELVSAANAGGYDVESDLVPNQTPFGGYPRATDPARVLYAVHAGGIPGTGHPTIHGPDPYVATRTANGWSTSYVGIPANDPYANSGPFASTLAEADAGLDTLAFDGAELCSPCFSDGKTGIPIRLPDGGLAQGMAGSMDPGPSVMSDGLIQRRLSADGSHLVFGATAQLEPDAYADTGDVSIYDRNLKTGITHVVSKTPGGANLPCLLGTGKCSSPGGNSDGIAELDISGDGSRIVVAQKISTDAVGNDYLHPYMNLNDSSHTVDLAPGTTSGVLYDGMTEDGSRVFLTTTDSLLAADTDSSADIYAADVDPNGVASLHLVSTGSGGTGNSDVCDPAFNSQRPHWNTVGAAANCDAVAVGGGGGVGSSDGSVYFLSPELLDGPSNGVLDAPNLYIARPASAPHYVTTLQSGLNGPPPRRRHPFVRSFGSFSFAIGVAVDHSNGNAYVLDDSGGPSGTGAVRKFNSLGGPISGFGTNGQLDGSNTPAESFADLAILGGFPAQLAVDQSNGDLYVPDALHKVIDKFDSSGKYLSQVATSGFPLGVAVDPSTRDLYVTENSGTVSIFDSAGKPVTQFPAISSPRGVAVDSSGNVYVSNSSQTVVYDSAGKFVRQLDANPSKGVAVDSSDDHVYVDEGERVVEFDSSGTLVDDTIGANAISQSLGLAVDSGSVYVADKGGKSLSLFGPSEPIPDSRTDSPLVIDALSAAASRRYGDFQLTPNGDVAVFTSTLSLTGFENVGHSEIFRYDAPSDQLECVSCVPSGVAAAGDANLASAGLSLTDDGRVFFTSSDALAPRDLDSLDDVYEWESGVVQLISTGTSPFDSGLLSASADGTDAYFFTRDTLAPQDRNGPLMKIYDAREGGGLFVIPPPPDCVASDECHGPGTQIPDPPTINTVRGSGGNTPSKKRRKKHHHHKRHHKKSHQKRAPKHNHGGAR
jgi:hypothetical protein